MSKVLTNIQMVEIAASGLKNLLPEIVFVGGAIVSLYVENKETEFTSIRPTEDVDCVIEVAGRSDYYKLEKKLRSLGFKSSTEQNAPICRWLYSGVTVDVMPTDSKIIGFSNRWYKPGIENAISYQLPSRLEIKIFSLPYFLASKIEAFKDRGKKDFLGSKDFEDIVTVLDGSADLRKELYKVDSPLKEYIREQFQSWVLDDDFVQSFGYHLTHGRNITDKARQLLDVLKNF